MNPSRSRRKSRPPEPIRGREARRRRPNDPSSAGVAAKPDLGVDEIAHLVASECDNDHMSERFALAEFGLPEVPADELNVYLDAASECFARHGLRRTRVTDIAEVVGVSRVTVYRQVGTTEQAARLLLSRELDRLLASLLPKLVAAETSEQVVSVIADAVTFAVEHPVMAKVLRDEPELVGAFVIQELDVLLERLDLLAQPVVARLESLGAGGREIDLTTVADWVARVVVTMVVAPPREPHETYLQRVLGTLLA